MSSSNTSSLSSTLTLLQDKMSLGFGLVCLILGVTGNFFNILLFSRRQFRTVTCCTYFLGASVAMFIQLSISGGSSIYSAYNANPLYYISAYCKIWYYQLQSLAMMYRWMLAAACLDRYALSSTNARLRRLSSVQIARRVVAALVLVWVVLPVSVLVFYDLRAGICTIIYGNAVALYHAIFSIINAYGIPISIMITGTLLIRRNLANKRERRHLNADHQPRTNEREHLQRKQDQQALAMLFVQIFVYIILTTPWVIFSIYLAVAVDVPHKSSDRLAIERFILYLVGVLLLLFPTASFYLFTLTSSMFCKELFIMFRPILCCKCCVNNRRIQPTATNIPLGTLTHH